MGTTRKTGNRRRGARIALDFNTSYLISTGRTFFREDELDPATVWATLGDEFMTEWIEKYPGTRPMLWWRFEAKERGWRPAGYGDEYIPNAAREWAPMRVIEQRAHYWDPATEVPQVELLKKWRVIGAAELSRVPAALKAHHDAEIEAERELEDYVKRCLPEWQREEFFASAAARPARVSGKPGARDRGNTADA